MTDGRKLVLVVDDDPDLRELMKLVLEGAGYGVQTASDGKEALERLALQLPSVVLLDMKMPGMNGWQFAEELRRAYDRRVPIVVVTAAEDARKTAEEIGAEGYLGKPFELDDVLSLVERCSAAAAGA